MAPPGLADLAALRQRIFFRTFPTVFNGWSFGGFSMVSWGFSGDFLGISWGFSWDFPGFKDSKKTEAECQSLSFFAEHFSVFDSKIHLHNV